MIFQVPLQDPPVLNTTFQVDLDNVTFTLTLFWNVRDGGWYLTIADSTNTPILACQRVVVNWPIGNNQTYNPNMPAGMLQFVDTSGQGLDPALDGSDLGTRVQLFYFDAAEMLSQLNGGPTDVSG